MSSGNQHNGSLDDGRKAPPEKSTKEIADTRDVTASSSSNLPRSVSYPPIGWDREESVVTSAPKSRQPQETHPAPASGIDDGLTEVRAREVLLARFRAAGVNIATDYIFKSQGLIVRLDGYDDTQCIGFSFVSHSDADVVTDFDEATDVAFAEMAAEKRAWVLVMHDRDIPNLDALERRVDAFFNALPPR